MQSSNWWESQFDAHLDAIVDLKRRADELRAVAEVWAAALAQGRKIIFFGNGGSAADAQHMAGELVGRLRLPRPALPALSLSANAAILTAVANDDGYELVFSRQIEALGQPGDVAVGLSTSGKSPNVIHALQTARRVGMVTILLTGEGGRSVDVAHQTLAVASSHVARIQEGHQLMGHLICEFIERGLAPSPPDEEGAVKNRGDGYFCHPSSYVDDGAQVGAGTRIWHFSHIQTGARIGKKCNLGQGVNVDSGAVLGDGVKVQNNVSIYNGVIVGDEAFLGPSCVFTNVVNPRSHVPRRDAFRPTRVGRRATIGANATVVCGHDVGEYAFVGAGALVSRDVPPYALVVGVPARLVGWMCACGEKLPIPLDGAPLAAGPEDVACEACGSFYRLAAGVLRPLPQD